jgi:DNA-directed RNA polymerase specialized sigma24 family protein
MDVLPERTPSLVSPLAIDFERFVLSASPALLRTAFLLSGDRDHAEDLLQAALWRVYQHWSVIRESPNGYAHTVLINLSRDRTARVATAPRGGRADRSVGRGGGG